MLKLKMVCGCGYEQAFQARSIDELIIEFEASGWQEKLRGGGGGVIPGECGDCRRERFS